MLDYSKEISEFNNFIEQSNLLDIPMIGRKFIWYKPNEFVKSIIDRVLVSKEWFDFWPNSKQWVLSRSVFNHCALMLKDNCKLKPFRSLDIWQSDGSFVILYATNGSVMRCMAEGCLL